MDSSETQAAGIWRWQPLAKSRREVDRLRDQVVGYVRDVIVQSGPLRMYALLARRHERSVRRLSRWKERLHGETLLCVGNGPSLRAADPRLLDRFPVLLTNHAARALPARPARYLGTVMTDDHRMIEAAPHLPAWARPLIVSSNLSPGPESWKAARIARRAEFAFRPAAAWVYRPEHRMGLRKTVVGDFAPGFTTNLRRDGLWLNRSVIFSTMQIACFLGVRRIVLLGVEMDYGGVQKHCVPNLKELVPNFDYESQARPSFELAQRVCEQRGIEVINATPGGLVEVFPRVPLEELDAGRQRAA